MMVNEAGRKHRFGRNPRGLMNIQEMMLFIYMHGLEGRGVTAAQCRKHAYRMRHGSLEGFNSHYTDYFRGKGFYLKASRYVSTSRDGTGLWFKDTDGFWRLTNMGWKCVRSALSQVTRVSL